MSNDSQNAVAGSLTRRSTIQTLGTLLAGAGVSGTVASDPGEVGYTVVQEGTTYEVEPLSGDVPVEQFYGFRLPDGYDGVGVRDGADGPFYESVGTRSLQRESTTITFLYDGPNGLSLVVVHDASADDAADDDDGGSASWNVYIYDADAEWLVRDDEYWDAETGERSRTNYDEWNTDSVPHQIDWTWAAGGTDGGVLGHLGEATALLIDPSFNEEAALHGQHYEGEVTEWQFLSGDRDDPDRVSLALDEPVALVGPTGDLSDVTAVAERNDAEETTDASSSEQTTTDADESDTETESSSDQTTDEATREEADDDETEDDDEAETEDEDDDGEDEGEAEDEDEAETEDESEAEDEAEDDGEDEREAVEEAIEEKREAIEAEREDDDGPGLELGRENDDEEDQENGEGRGRGNGEGRGNGNGEGRGRGNGEGRGRGNGEGRGNGNGGEDDDGDAESGIDVTVDW